MRIWIVIGLALDFDGTDPSDIDSQLVSGESVPWRVLGKKLQPTREF